MLTTRETIDRKAAMAWYKKNRARTAQLFDLLTDSAYYTQPIALRHPIVFYEGHLPAFSLNTLVKRGLGRGGVDESLERLFARGIDPDEATRGGTPHTWPERRRVRAFVEATDDLVLDALAHADLDVPGHALLDRGDAVFTILEHEAMHQETLLYMWHRLPFDQKRRPADYQLVTDDSAIANDEVRVPAGNVQLGAVRGQIPFGWDNEFGAVRVDVPAFAIDRRNVTNGDFLEFVQAGGYERRDLWADDDWQWVREHDYWHPSFWERVQGQWMWRGMFELLPLPLDWPAYVSQAEARAFATWRGQRLPTEAEYQRDVYGWHTQEIIQTKWGTAEHAESA